MMENVSVLKPGLRLEGGGTSKGAIVLAHKESTADTDVVLCYAAESPHDPFVVWYYYHNSGSCGVGSYHNNLWDAIKKYHDRS